MCYAGRECNTRLQILKRKQIRLNEKKSFVLFISSITATGMFSNNYFEFSFLKIKFPWTVYRQNNASCFWDKPTYDVCILIYTQILR